MTKLVHAPTIGSFRTTNAYQSTNSKRGQSSVRFIAAAAILAVCVPHWCAAQELEQAPAIKSTRAKSTPIKPQEDELPKLELSKELMFKVLSSEIAIQRGEWGSAFATLMSVAQETGDPRLAKKAAEVAMGAQQLDEALSAIQLWRKLSPHSFEAGQYYLSLMVVKSDYGAVEQFFIDQFKSDESADQAPLLYQAQRLLARMNDKNRAFSTLERIIQNSKESLDSHIALARGAYISGDLARSKDEALKAQAIQADSELAFLTLAQASDKEEAANLALEFIRRFPQALEVHLAYATMLIESRQLEAARAEFLTLLRKFESNKKPISRILMTLGAIELELGKSDAAEASLKRFLNEAAEDEDKNNAFINLAQVELQRKNIKAADAWLAKVEHNDAKSATWYNVQMRRALLMASDQRFSEARQFLQTIKFNNDAEQALLLQTEAQIMKAAGQELEAFVLLEAAIGNFPRHSDLLYDYAMLAENLKYYEEMEGALKQLINVAPNNAFAYNALGYSYADRNIHLDEAELLLKRALEITPEDPYILDSFAWLKYRQGDLTQAEQILRRVLAIRRDPEIEIHLAEILWKQEKNEEAQTLFASARKKDPENALLKSTLQRLDVKLP